MSTDWSEALAPADLNLAEVGPDGLRLSSFGSNAYINAGWKSIESYSRSNLIILARFSSGYGGLSIPMIGAGDGFGGVGSAVTGNNLILSASTASYLTSWTSANATPTQQVTVTNCGHADATATPNRGYWVAIKLLATGAEMKIKQDGAAGWTTGDAAASIVTLATVNLLIMRPYAAGLAHLRYMIAEQGDGSWTGADLDAIIAASQYKGTLLDHWTPSPGAETSPTFRQGVASTTSVHMSQGSVLDPSAMPVTGISHTDIVCKLYKNGVASTKTLDGSSWVEVDSVNFPGFYNLNLSTTDTNTLGELFIRLTRAGSKTFREIQIHASVLGLPADYAPALSAIQADVDLLQADTASIIGDLASVEATQAAHTTALAIIRKITKNRVAVNSTGGGVVYDDDGTTPLYTFQLKDALGANFPPPSGAWTERTALS